MSADREKATNEDPTRYFDNKSNNAQVQKKDDSKILELSYSMIHENTTPEEVAEIIFNEQTCDDLKEFYFKLNGTGRLKAGSIAIIADPKDQELIN